MRARRNLRSKGADGAPRPGGPRRTRRRNFRIAVAALYLISFLGRWGDDVNFFDVVAEVSREDPTFFDIMFTLAVVGLPVGSLLVVFYPNVTLLLVAYRALGALLLTFWSINLLFIYALAGTWVFTELWGLTLYFLTLLLSFPVEYFPGRRRPRPRTDPDVFK